MFLRSETTRRGLGKLIQNIFQAQALSLLRIDCICVFLGRNAAGQSRKPSVIFGPFGSTAIEPGAEFPPRMGAHGYRARRVRTCRGLWSREVGSLFSADAWNKHSDLRLTR